MDGGEFSYDTRPSRSRHGEVRSRELTKVPRSVCFSSSTVSPCPRFGNESPSPQPRCAQRGTSRSSNASRASLSTFSWTFWESSRVSSGFSLITPQDLPVFRPFLNAERAFLTLSAVLLCLDRTEQADDGEGGAKVDIKLLWKRGGADGVDLGDSEGTAEGTRRKTVRPQYSRRLDRKY